MKSPLPERATAVVLWMLLQLPVSLAAQSTVRFLPQGPMPRLHAAPREAGVHTKLLLELESPSRFGQIVSGDVALGDRLPLLRYQRSNDGPAVTLGVEGGVFGRFNMETKERDLIATDWIFGLPLTLEGSRYWIRLRYHHISSHLGDEYLERFEVSRAHYNRDAFDTTVYHLLLPELGVYAGAGYGFRVEPRADGRLTVRGGVELASRSDRGFGRPFLVADVRFDTWERQPAVSVQGGVRLRAEERQPDVRVLVEIFTGPSPLGQFAAFDTTWLALGVTVKR